MKICKAFNPKCLLINCCSETCDEFKKYIYHNAYNYIRRVQECCICGNNKVKYYIDNIPSIHIDESPEVSLYMKCESCKGDTILTFKNRINHLYVTCNLKTRDEIKRIKTFPQYPTFFNLYSKIGTTEDAINYAMDRVKRS